MRKRSLAVLGMALALSTTSLGGVGTAMAAEAHRAPNAEQVFTRSIGNGARSSMTYTGDYLILDVSASTNSASGTVSNNDFDISRYASITTKAYDKNGKVLYTGSNSGAITTGAKTAWDLNITKGVVYKATGAGKIYKGSASSSGLQESKTLTAMAD